MQWLIYFGSTVVLTSRKKIGTLDIKVVLDLHIFCSDTTISNFLTSIGTDATAYAQVRAKWLLGIESIKLKLFGRYLY